jgi:hypothetical protein
MLRIDLARGIRDLFHHLSSSNRYTAHTSPRLNSCCATIVPCVAPPTIGSAQCESRRIDMELHSMSSTSFEVSSVCDNSMGLADGCDTASGDLMAIARAAIMRVTMQDRQANGFSIF